jgi:NTP pyrophosphatase (non-canonical NTP hydrolase)
VEQCAQSIRGLKEETELLLRAAETTGRVQKDLQQWTAGLTEKIGEVAQQLDQSRANIESQTRAAGRNWEECRIALREVGQQVGTSAREFNQGATRSLNDVLEAMDRSLSDITTHLSTTLKETHGVVEELPGILTELKNTLSNKESGKDKK